MLQLPSATTSHWARGLRQHRGHGDGLSRAHVEALQQLAWQHDATGQWPTDAEIAAAAGMAPSTVQEARIRGRDLGLLEWQHTAQIVNGRRRQGRNAYTLRFPDTETQCARKEALKQRLKERLLRRRARWQPVAPTLGPVIDPGDRLAAVLARLAAGKDARQQQLRRDMTRLR